MRLANCTPQTFFRFRNRNYMDMVRHEAVRPYLDIELLTPFRHQAYVRSIVVITEKGLLPSISPLCYVVRIARRYHPCNPCHALTIRLH